MRTGVLPAAALLAAAALLWPSRPRRARPRDPIGAAAPGRRGARRPRPPRGAPRHPDPRDLVLQLLEAVATQVRAGAAPQTAWRVAVEVLAGPDPCGPPAAGAAGRWSLAALPRPGPGEPLAPALRRAVLAGADPVLLSLAAGWQLAEEVGAPLADVLDRLCSGLREEAEVVAEIEASLAAPRATARLLAVLPLAGIGLGELIGARPLAVLVGTPVGRVCAVAGALLALAGQLWTRRLVLRAAALA